MIIRPPQFVLERLGIVKKNRNKNFDTFSREYMSTVLPSYYIVHNDVPLRSHTVAVTYYDEMPQDSVWRGTRFVESPMLRDNQWFISHDSTFMIKQEEE